MLEPGFHVSFELNEKRGAALVTKYRTYREDAELERHFGRYTKRHYNSWVEFARDRGHGDDLKPVLVTGVDMTRDFAMMAYSKNRVSLASEFTIPIPVVGSVSASAWGTWRTEGLVHTNCGPQLCRPPSPTQTTEVSPSDTTRTETIPDEYNQCVFVRYFTIRKRALVIPTVMRAAAGPHDLGPGGRDDEELFRAETRSNSDSGSDLMSWDEGGDDDRCLIAGGDAHIVIRETTSARPSPYLPAHSIHPLREKEDGFDVWDKGGRFDGWNEGDSDVWDEEGDSDALNGRDDSDAWDERDDEESDLDKIAEYILQASSQCDPRMRRGLSEPPSLEFRCRICTHPSSRHRAAS